MTPIDGDDRADLCARRCEARPLGLQTWVTNRGGIIVIHGNFKTGTLVLEGEAHLQDVQQRIT